MPSSCSDRPTISLLPVAAWVGLLLGTPVAAAADVPTAGAEPPAAVALTSLRLAIDDLRATYPGRYDADGAFDRQCRDLERQAAGGQSVAEAAVASLRRRALLANPLLDFERMIVLRRRRGQLGLPTNHQCNTALKRQGYDNELALLELRSGRVTTLFRPPDGSFVGEVDLRFDAERLLFTMPDAEAWQVHELTLGDGGRRRVSPAEPGIDCFDACYLPDGRIVYASTASFTGVPCWHGQERACSLYLMNADGSGVRQLCFDQDLDLHPSVLNSGQVVYSRWDYAGTMHMYLRPLMAMNPDGIGQRALYGSSSYYPNSLFFPKAVPAASTKLAAILSGYHGPGRMGELVILDTDRGWHEDKGIVHRIGHRGKPLEVQIKDDLIGKRWPKFLHPYPLSEKYLLAAAQRRAKGPWTVYLVDVFDNFVALAGDEPWDYFEPIALRKTPRPPAIPDQVIAGREATIYLHNVYAGPGLAGVPRGSVKRLRIAAYEFGYPGMAGPDKIGRAGPWEPLTILGTVPVYEDGSAAFKAPACVPLTVQPLDAEGKALALMRSWYTAMPGERASCVGCHESPREAPRGRLDRAAAVGPVPIEPWRGPPRGFDFEREVQPVLDRHCLGCHDGDAARPTNVDLRRRAQVPGYAGLPLSPLESTRLDATLRASDRFPAQTPSAPYAGDRRALYSPAYEALVPLVRRVNIEDYVGVQVAAEYHADTSELIQMLRKGHGGVVLDAEDWDRLYTWIDLNGPYYGAWSQVAPIPEGVDARRRTLAARYGGPSRDAYAAVAPAKASPAPVPIPMPAVAAAGAIAPSSAAAAAPTPRNVGSPRGHWSIELGEGLAIRMVRIPAGSFIMGDDAGEADERPAAKVQIARDFWMSVCEITNAQFRRFDAGHRSGLFTKRSLSPDGPGVDLDGETQPAVRVSWRRADDFCRWLSGRVDREVALPTEAQWEYACRSGGRGPLSYGGTGDDFAAYANLADAALERLYETTGGLIVLQPFAVDRRFDDRFVATAAVGSFAANAWGLHDMHGNAAEWTCSAPAAYPYNLGAAGQRGRKVVRGGSFLDRPKRCRSAYRLDYPDWQRVHNVGFRIVCPANDAPTSHAHAAANPSNPEARPH